jgi:hypothetical protein
MNITTDAHIDRIISEIPPGELSAWVRTAMIEKDVRDRHRGELDEVLARLAEHDRRITALERQTPPPASS